MYIVVVVFVFVHLESKGIYRLETTFYLESFQCWLCLLQVLNLFLALLIASFGTENLESDTPEEPGAPNKLAEAINRFSR